jgi:DNA primase
MPSNDRTLEEIKDRIDIVDLISEYVHLKKTGQNWKGLCPFHTEKTPSFVVSPAKQIYHCFGCNSGGDIFTFLTNYENLTFPEALNLLAGKAGVVLKPSPGGAAPAGSKEKLVSMHKEALNFFQQSLSKNAKALNYLRERGISLEAQQDFSVGYAPKGWNGLMNVLKGLGYKPEDMKKAGLVSQGAKGFYDTFRERIIFPIYDLKGDVMAFGGRALEGGEPKYLNSPETLIFNKRRVLYGLNRAREEIKKKGFVLFMEGYLDVISAHMHGFSNAVAPLGTALTEEHGKLIRRFTGNIILLFDSDQAGRKAAKNAAKILFQNSLNVKVLTFPEGEDPDSFLKKKGRDAFAKLIENRQTIIDFIVQGGGDKKVIAREAVEIICKIPDALLRNDYVKMLSEKLGIHETLVLEELNKARKKPESGYKAQAPKTHPKEETRPLYEVSIIRLMFQMPERASEVFEELNGNDFSDPELKSIFIRMKEGKVTVDNPIAGCDEDEKLIVTQLLLRNEQVPVETEFEDPHRALNDCVRSIKKLSRNRALQNLRVKISEAEQRKDLQLLKTLQAEQQRLLKS